MIKSNINLGLINFITMTCGILNHQYISTNQILYDWWEGLVSAMQYHPPIFIFKLMFSISFLYYICHYLKPVSPFSFLLSEQAHLRSKLCP